MPKHTSQWKRQEWKNGKEEKGRNNKNHPEQYPLGNLHIIILTLTFQKQYELHCNEALIKLHHSDPRLSVERASKENEPSRNDRNKRPSLSKTDQNFLEPECTHI